MADSVRKNAALRNEMRAGSTKALARRIKSRELISKAELIERLGCKKRWVSKALGAGRLFSLKDPSGSEYFPAFFADDRYNRRALGRVGQSLDGLPGESKYYFFNRKSVRLCMTALEALEEGRTM